MNLFYNFEVDDDISIKINNQEIIIFFDELKKFVKSRLKVLETEINKEEALSIKMIVLLLPTDLEYEQGILYIGYSKELTDKMKSCITIDDIKYLHNRLSHILDRLN